MEITFSDSVNVTDATSVGQARRSAMTLAHRLDFDEVRSGELALLATEASRNVLLHGGGGQVILAGSRDGADAQALILAMDKGPGIADVARALGDGYSTAGTMGAGMGAMQRLATCFEIFTGKTGTIVLLEVGKKPGQSTVRAAGLAVPYPGEKLCGDGWACHQTSDRSVVLLVDGLGHGMGAADAAEEAIAVFRAHVDLSPVEILDYIHDGLRKTRGAVAAVADIRPGIRALRYAGVGNISGVHLSGSASRSLVSHNGTLGATAPRMQEFTSEWKPSDTLVLHSDGVQTRWDLAAYAGLIARHPAIIAGTLLRDFRRQRDDASVVVLKAA